MFRIAKDTVCRSVDGKLVLMSLESGAFYSLNDTGAVVWKLLSDRRSTDDICSQIAREFDVPPKTAHRDVEYLLKELQNERLIEKSS